jgi:hypothetical protein
MKPVSPKSPRRPFPHKSNVDGSFDSICPKCFTILDSKEKEIDLRAAEEAHICGGLKLGQVLHPMDR